MMIKNSSQQRVLMRSGITLLVCLVFIITSGCAPLKKKFTRKKKQEGKETERTTPVLDPIEYPPKVYSVKEQYEKHYGLWKIWNDELLQVVGQDGSDKRQKYLLAQIMEQLNEMGLLLDDARKEGLDEVRHRYQGIEGQYERAAALRSTFSMRKKIELAAKEIRNHFAPQKIFQAGE